MLTFIKKVYKNQKKDYHVLLMILTLISSFEMCFLAMYDAFTQFNFDYQERTSIHGIPILASFVALILIVFVTKYFISHKKQEFSILLLSGRKPKDLLHYLLIQFALLLIVANIIGCFLGFMIMKVIQSTLIFSNTNVTLAYSLTNVLIYNGWYLIFTIIIVLFLSAHQFVNLDRDLAKYLSQKNIIEKPIYDIKMSAISSEKKVPWMSIFVSLIVLYLTVDSLLKLIDPNLSTTELLMAFTFALIGIYAILMSAIPLLYDICHHRLLRHPILMNALSRFNDFSKTMLVLVSLNMLILPVLLFLIFFSSIKPVVQAVMLPCFIMMIMMIGLCFILRFMIYNDQCRPSLATFSAIGYSPIVLNKISLIKNLLFALFTFFIPFLFMVELFYRAYIEKLLNQQTIIIMMLVYIIVDCLIIIYISFKERMTQKEVSQNVKYLNRGQ
ncbi:MAG: FtsX-like permease family protein [Longibaculum sp.]